MEIAKRFYASEVGKVDGFNVIESHPTTDSDLVPASNLQAIDHKTTAAYTAAHTGAVYHGTKRGAPVRRLTKIGRNEPCPCGSGKKFKRCHLMVIQP